MFRRFGRVGRRTPPRSAAAAPWSPLDDAGLALWLRADLGRTGSPADALVSQAGDAVLTAAGAARPTVSTSAEYGGQTVLLGAGAQYMRDTSYTTIAVPYLCIVVARCTSGTTQILVDDGGAGSDSPAIYYATGQWRAQGGTTALLSGVTSLTAPRVHALIANGASSEYYIDDFTTPKASGTTGPTDNQSLTIMANQANAGAINGEWAETIITTSTSLLADYRTYLNARYGLSIA